MRRLIVAEGVVTSKGRIGNAVLVESGRIAAVGEHTELRTADVVEERYPGGTIIPGLRDAHLHAVPYAALLQGCSLKRSTSIADLQRRLERHAATLPAGMPVVATRFDDEHLAESRLPTRRDLDAAVPDRPVVIYRYCGHIAVANSRALDESGIDRSTPDPDGGTIDRTADGVPTGVLRETASGLIAGALARGGRVTEDQLVDALTRLAGLGLTSIGAMIGYGESPSEKLEAETELWRAAAGRLPIKVHGFLIADSPDAIRPAAERIHGAGRRLEWLGVKRFADGSLGGHTAAMHAPFADHGSTGTLRLTRLDTEIARTGLALGGMVAIHAIGDRAVDGALDIFEGLIAEGANPADLRMEHVSVISPTQIERFAALGVTASVQPAFLASESDWLTARVGEERLDWVYPFASFRRAGIPTAGSSDSPVEPPHPLWGISAAIGRHGIAEHERLDGLAALSLFTDGAAAALREPEPLSVGAPADVVVVDTDPSAATAGAVHDAAVLETYVDGSAVVVDRSLPTWVD